MKKLWLPFLQHNKIKFAASLALGLLMSCTTLAIPLCIGKYLQISFGGGAGRAKALQNLGIELPDSLNLFFVVFAALLLLKFAATWAYNYSSSLLGECFANYVRTQMFLQHVVRAAPGDKAPSTAALMGMTADLKPMQNLLTKGLLGFMRDLLFIGIGLYVLANIQPIFTLGVSLLSILFFWGQRWWSGQLEPVAQDKRNRQHSLQSFVLRASEGPEINGKHLETFERKSLRLMNSLQCFHKRSAALKALVPLALYGMLGLIMFLAGVAANRLQTYPSDVVAYLLLLITLFPTLRNLIGIERVWMLGRLSAKKFTTLLEQQRPQTQLPGSIYLSSVKLSSRWLHCGNLRQP